MKVHQLFSESMFHDARKARASAALDKVKELGIRLVRMNKDGSESRMHDATKWFQTPDEAITHHNNMVKLNPDKYIHHTLYVSNALGNFKLPLKGHYERKKT